MVSVTDFWAAKYARQPPTSPRRTTAKRLSCSGRRTTLHDGRGETWAGLPPRLIGHATITNTAGLAIEHEKCSRALGVPSVGTPTRSVSDVPGVAGGAWRIRPAIR